MSDNGIRKNKSSRRGFIKSTGMLLATGGIAPSVHSNTSSTGSPGAVPVSVKVDGDRVNVRTATLSAVLDKGILISLVRTSDGRQWISPFDPSATPVLQIVYSGGKTLSVDEAKFGNITARSLSENRAEFILHGWDGDGIITVTADPETGDLIIEPSAYSSRPGVRACRWCVSGIGNDLELVAPFFQGVKLALDDPLIAGTRWHWPYDWEAGLAILQGNNGGFWVHNRDIHYRYKALKVGIEDDTDALGFESEAFGPIDENLSAGGLSWRINVFEGDWKVPASRYREWHHAAYKEEIAAALRPEWVDDISLALSWCPADGAILDALAGRISPRKVLIHFPPWRTDSYDENYPAYNASPEGAAFIRRALEMGFHIMPHFNAIDMDPSNPAFALVRDFQFRDIENSALEGWSWYRGRGIGVPESNANLLGNRDKKVMVKIHPGLAMWRSVLGKEIHDNVNKFGLDTVFVDVTLHSRNLRQCLVEGMTSTEGMQRLIAHIGGLGKGVVVAGEGLNEITALGQSFAQAHLFKSWHDSVEGLERTGGCALNDFLIGDLCRTIGYNRISGDSDNDRLRMRMHREHGLLPTLIINSADEIVKPNRTVREELERAIG
ncbi:DUF6259 domain-containing protein [Candidatus Latescibacterota bacterium]